MNVSESNRLTALHSWILRQPMAGGRVATAREARDALAYLSNRAYATQHAGPTADHVHQEWLDLYGDGDVSPASLLAFVVGALGQVETGPLQPAAALASIRDFLITGQPHDGRRCYVCGCTDDRACPGGCAWLPDPVGARCSACSLAAARMALAFYRAADKAANAILDVVPDAPVGGD